MAACYNAMDIASLFIQLANDLPNNHIDNLKLNKLCYFAQGWHLARFDLPFFEEEIQAWQYGPVVPTVYAGYKVCGSGPIIEPAYIFDENEISVDEAEIIVEVYRHYGIYTSAALIDITHRPGSPWSNVYVPAKNNIISKAAMKAYFLDSGIIKRDDFIFSSDNIVEGIMKDE